MTTYVGGVALFQHESIKRFDHLLVTTLGGLWQRRQKARAKHLKLQKGESAAHDPRDPRPSEFDQVHPSCLMTVYNRPDSLLKWAPRDALAHPSTTLAEWRSHGYGSYEMLLSLIGANVDQKALLGANKFVRFGGYSYLHLSFDRFVQVLRRLHPVDRIFCYMIPLGVPVHMYFDIDGDFSQFPDVIRQDEACLNAFLAEVRELFRLLFGRELDCSRLTLLQATSSTKLSWHLHVPSEAFRDVHHHKRFVERLNARLIERKGAAPATFLLNSTDKSLVDPAPYMSNQNFRAPYCCKPGKTALLPRTYVPSMFAESGVIQLEEAKPADCLHANIDEELLWRCHPALAQPGAGYTYLEVEATTKGKKRKADALTTDNRARKLTGALDAATAARTSTSRKEPKEAISGSCRPLTSPEEEVVKAALRVHLGDAVEFDEATWYKSRYGREVCVKGVCTAATARCLTAGRVHARNRMTFQLEASGTIVLRCFKCHSPQRFDWILNEKERALMCVSQPALEAEHSAAGLESDESMVVAAVDTPPPGPDSGGVKTQLQLIRFIREVAGLAPIFRSKRQHPKDPEPTDDPHSLQRELFREAIEHAGGKFTTDGTTVTNVDRDQLYEQFCSYKKRMDLLLAAESLTWRQVVRVSERYLDPSRPAIRDLFKRHTNVAVRSGQGTNKTGVIFVMVLMWMLQNPELRVLILSNRKTYASTVKERGSEFDRDISSAFEVALGFRSYTEEYFRLPSNKSLGKYDDEEKRREIQRATNEANRRLVSTPRLIVSIQSLGRLFAVTDDFGEPVVPEYDVIIPDEFMELLAIFHGQTMDAKRRIVLDGLTSLMSKAHRILVADADLDDDTALAMLRGLTGGKAFAKLENTAKTIKRTYLKYTNHAQWRLAILQCAEAGKKLLIACNTKAEVLSIINDPEIKRLIEEHGLRVKGLHADSPAEDRREYIDSVHRWSELDILIFSPTISHGVNFDAVHFDLAFLYASDNSTTACQTFQQLNRARRISSNVVHVFINAHPKRWAHLPCEYDELKEELNEEIRRSHGDVFAKTVHERRHNSSIPFPLVKQAVPRHGHNVIEDEVASESRYTGGTYVLDTKVDPLTSVRVLFDSLGNELYLRNQMAINRSRVNFEKLLIQQMESAGGIVKIVSESDSDMKRAEQHVKEAKAADAERHTQELQSILASPDITSAIEFRDMKARLHLLGEEERKRVRKAEWKELYGIAHQDTERLHQVADFPTRFGDERRMEQARHIQNLRAEVEPVVVTTTSDPIGFLTRETHSREHTELFLHSTGFLSCFGNQVVVAIEQQQLLEPGSTHRNDIVRRWEQEPLEYRGWWLNCKKKNDWNVRDGDVCGDDGTPVTSTKLFQVLLGGCRQHVDKKFHIKIATGRARKASGRGYLYQLDRTHWNDVSEGLLGMPPQKLDDRCRSLEQRRNSGQQNRRRSGSLAGELTIENNASSEADSSEVIPTTPMEVDPSSATPMEIESEESDSLDPAAEDVDELAALLEGLNETQAARVRRLVATASEDEGGGLSMNCIRILARQMRLSNAGW